MLGIISYVTCFCARNLQCGSACKRYSTQAGMAKGLDIVFTEARKVIVLTNWLTDKGMGRKQVPREPGCRLVQCLEMSSPAAVRGPDPGKLWD